MAVSRAERRSQREPRALREYGAAAPAALDLLELTELAWHDCYGEITPPDEVVDDIFVCGQRELSALIAAARLAVTDARDLRVAADRVRATTTGSS